MKLTFLHYNLYHFKLNGIINYINKINPDVLAVQEITSYSENWGEEKDFDGFERMKKRIGMKGVLGKSFQVRDKHKSYQGCAIFSKLPVVKSKTHFLRGKFSYQDEFEGDWRDEPRILLEADIQISKEATLTIFTTHLSYNDAFKENFYKEEENKRLLSILEDNRSKNFVFSGDLNSTSRSHIVKTLNQSYKNLTPEPVPTWTLVPFDYKGFKCSSLKYQLDYVFVNGNLEVKDVKVPDVKFSDHLPILAKLEI